MDQSDCLFQQKLGTFDHFDQFDQYGHTLIIFTAPLLALFKKKV
jgi:hypothetical protein